MSPHLTIITLDAFLVGPYRLFACNAWVAGAKDLSLRARVWVDLPA